MPSPTLCTVSGTLRDISGTVLPNATLTFSSIKPFIHTTDNSLVVNYSVTATTSASGTFSVSIIETATPATTLILTIAYQLGTASNKVTSQYSVTIPNSASATLASLISGQ